jgi:hypothetical protein
MDRKGKGSEEASRWRSTSPCSNVKAVEVEGAWRSVEGAAWWPAST